VLGWGLCDPRSPDAMDPSTSLRTGSGAPGGGLRAATLYPSELQTKWRRGDEIAAARFRHRHQASAIRAWGADAKPFSNRQAMRSEI
jgi:hypothetical protein